MSDPTGFMLALIVTAIIAFIFGGIATINAYERRHSGGTHGHDPCRRCAHERGVGCTPCAERLAAPQ